MAPATLDAAGKSSSSSLRYFSVFSGIGGFELGIGQVAPHWQCVGYSEIDRHALSVYKQHFPHHTGYGDITQFDLGHLPDFDFLVGGFPCQPYSQAGRRRGLQDSRGGPILAALFGLIEAKRPPYLLLENVRGLLSQDKGRTFQGILERLRDIGYETEWQVLSSQVHGGVPQRRERVYIIAYFIGIGGRNRSPDRLDGLDGSPGAGGRGQVFPLAGVRTQDKSLAPRAEGGKDTSIATARASANTSAAVSLHVRRISRADRTANPSGKAGQGANIATSTSVAATKRLGLSQRHFFTLTTRPHAALLIGCGVLSRFPEGKLLSEVMSPGTLESLPIRYLTPLEWERLQGFPDDWTAGAGLSDAQRYRCLGNAVTVGVVGTVISKIRAVTAATEGNRSTYIA